MAFENALAYMTRTSEPVRLQSTTLKDALAEADTMGALWVVAEQAVVGKTIMGTWARVDVTSSPAAMQVYPEHA